MNFDNFRVLAQMLLLAKRALNHAPIVHFLSLHELELQVYWGLASFDHHFGYN
jgi:hypothetical protein